jgi:hypothetical protein
MDHDLPLNPFARMTDGNVIDRTLEEIEDETEESEARENEAEPIKIRRGI